MRDDKNSLFYWRTRYQRAGIPIPETRIQLPEALAAFTTALKDNFRDNNEIVIDMGCEVLSVVKNTPVLAGVNGTDPVRRNVPSPTK
jgi:hypothetical protein